MLKGHILTRKAIMLVDFLDGYRAKSTRAMYLSAWVKFLSLVYSARLKGASPGILDPWVAKYINDLRNGRRDLSTDLQALAGACRTRRTCLGYQSAIRTLLAGAGIALPPAGERRLRRGPGLPRHETGGEVLTPGRILRLMEHLDTRGRAILYILASSGARLGEVLSIHLDDLDLDSRPARFRVRDAGGRVSRVAFISREAVGAIRVYLIVRDRFLASARSRGGAAAAHLLFPLGARAFEQIWGLALSKAGLEGFDRVSGRRTLTPGAARRFFAERMRTALPDPLVAMLMGSPGPSPPASRRSTEAELARAYLEGERVVTLHHSHRKDTMAARVAELERLVGELRKQIGEGNSRDEPLRKGVPEEEREQEKDGERENRTGP
jgi:integrase